MLTDAQWARIEPLLPYRTPRRGGRWRDHRQVIDAIAWKYRTGSPWMDLPAEFGSWKGAYSRLRNGRSAGPGSECSPPCRPRRTPTRT
ncbi:transposase [Streptomyces sp. NBC_00264]|uniref:transposase n=1 Tax=Streptomyces sp. NBC_00264 TaxID=2975693 RepID=UPI00338E40B4